MNRSLDHLPESKRRELDRLLEILFRAFEDATQNRAARKRGRILKIVLFGSYARGDWVDDPIGGYKSDYDLLIVVDNEALTETADYWLRAQKQPPRALEVPHALTAAAPF